MEVAHNDLDPLGSFLSGGGEMGARIGAFDWSKTPLGPTSSWSPSLKMMVRFLLANRFPMLLWWGPQFIQIYNDPYRPVLGAKHPALGLGRSVSECWSEIWHILRPLIETPFHGGPATWMEDIQLEINRYDFIEETHFTIAYSPVPDETVTGGIGGVLATVHEISEKVVGERRVRVLRDLGSRAVEAKTAKEACRMVAETLAKHPKDIPFALLYLIDPDGRRARLASAAGLAEGGPASPLLIELDDPSQDPHVWPLTETVQTESLQIVEDLAARFGEAVPQGPWADAPQQAAVIPIRSNIAHQLAGLFVVGISSRLRLDDSYRSFIELAATQIATALANARAYEEEKRRAEALAEIDRTKTAFFSNVSHEFRTPLTLMLGPLEDAISGALDPSQKQELALVHRNGLRLLKLVNTLLDFSRIEAERVQAVYEPTDLARLTTELASVFRSAVERAGLRLLVDCPSLPELIYVDREMWEKIVLNLLSNAFKFTFEGTITVSLRPAGEHVELQVRDTGTGIAESELPRLFERFHRIRGAQSRTHEGSGIGLALVRELVHLHGGSVSVESAVSSGTTFTVRIPTGSAHLPKERIGAERTQDSTTLRTETYAEEALRWLPNDTEVESRTSDIESPDHEAVLTEPGARILLADDNADMREYVKRILAPHWTVETASDGRAALDAVQTSLPDLLITDVMMPRLDGFELLRELRADPRTRRLPVILLSARAGEESRIEGLQEGADDYLVKPFSARELIARVGAHLKIARIRNEAEEQIRHSQELLRLTSDTVPALISYLDTERRYQFCNRAYLEWFGLANEDIIGRRLWEVLGEEAWQAIQPRIDVAFGGETVDFETAITYISGDNRWINATYTPHRNGDGEVIGVVAMVSDISARKRAEEQLRESEARLRAFVTASSDVVFGMSADWRVMRHLEGRDFITDTQEPSFTWLENYIHPDDQSRVLAAITNAIQSTSTFELEHRIRRTDGTLGWAFSRAIPLLDAQGEIVEWFGTASDVTERKQAGEAFVRLSILAEQQRRLYQTILSNTPDLVYVFDLNHRFTYANEALLTMWGKTWDEAIGRNCLELGYEPWHAALHDREIDQVIATRQPIRGEVPFTGTHGRRIYDYIFVPVLGADGQVEAIAGTTRDVTERKQVEEALRLNESQLQTLFDKVPLGVFVVGSDFRIRKVNPIALPTFGNIPELIGRDFDEVIHILWSQEYADEIVRLFRHTLETGEPYFTPERIEERRDRQVTEYYEWQINRIPLAEGGYGVVCYFRDISAQVFARLEREKLLAAEKRAREAADAASIAKDEFLATVSHELRSPLNAMLGWSRILSSGNLDEETAMRAVKSIEQNAKAQAQLIEDLLDVSRIISGKFRLSKEPVQIARVIEAALDTVRPTAEAKGVSLNLSLCPEVGLVSGDEARLQQVVWNLLANAVKFTPRYGQVQVELQRSSSHIEIVVKDTGQGIAPDFLPYVFDRFRQADGSNTRSHGGLGLGLAIVRHITELHGGSVAAHSAGQGLGASFTIRLPLLLIPASPADRQSKQTEGFAEGVLSFKPSRSLEEVKVLVVDDDPETLHLLRAVLSECGAQVKTATSAEEGFAEVLAWRPQVIVSDIGMPEVSGYEFMKQVKSWAMETGTWIPSVALTAYARTEDRMKALDSGFQIHVPKPVEPAELITVISSLIKRPSTN
jgi:PAS domain S-box-containing protein